MITSIIITQKIIQNTEAANVLIVLCTTHKKIRESLLFIVENIGVFTAMWYQTNQRISFVKLVIFGGCLINR